MIKGRFGIMQGRLTPAATLQAFPTGAWQEEFALAAELGFDTIEWLLDDVTGDKNPLYFAGERSQIRSLSTRHRLPVATLCADYIQRAPLSTGDEGLREQRVRKFQEIIASAAEIGVSCILIPVFETTLAPGSEEEENLVAALSQVCPSAQEKGLRLGLEAGWIAERQLALLKRVAHPSLGIYYDLGNATADGYDIAADIRTLGPALVGVHIKDRPRGGGSVLLGEGETKFGEAFAALAETGFAGTCVLETPRGDDPAATAWRHLKFVREAWRAAATGGEKRHEAIT